MESNSNLSSQAFLKTLILAGLACGFLAGGGYAQEPSPVPKASAMPSPAAAAATVPGAILASGTALAGSGTGATAALACGSSQAPSLVPKKAKPRTDSIFSALVLATNVEQPAPPPPELAGFAPRLKTVFGYNSLELVGSHTELMDQSDERWLVPSKLFSLSIKSKKEKNASYLLNLQLFQETKMLAGFDAKLGTESPIFIRGPQYGKGQLVIVVEVKP